MKICAFGPIKNGLRPLLISECEKASSRPPSDKMEGLSAPTPSRRETDDNYFAVLTPLAPRWRVILCRDGMQYILQRQFGKRLHEAVWRGETYHTTRRSLIRACAKRDLLSDATAQAAIGRLPSLARKYAAQRAQN